MKLFLVPFLSIMLLLAAFGWQTVNATDKRFVDFGNQVNCDMPMPANQVVVGANAHLIQCD